MNMIHTKETLDSLTSTQLINMVLEQQQTIKEQAEANLSKPTNKKPALDPDTLFAWLKERSKGKFVTATKKDVTKHFECSDREWSKAMGILYDRGSLSIHKYQGKRIISSHIINDT